MIKCIPIQTHVKLQKGTLFFRIYLLTLFGTQQKTIYTFISRNLISTGLVAFLLKQKKTAGLEILKVNNNGKKTTLKENVYKTSISEAGSVQSLWFYYWELRRAHRLLSLVPFCAPEIKANYEDRRKTSNTKWRQIQYQVKLQVGHVNSKNIVLSLTPLSTSVFCPKNIFSCLHCFYFIVLQRS